MKTPFFFRASKAYFNNEHKNKLIIDVRTREEYAESHIPGSLNIPLDELESTHFSAEKNTSVVFHCRSGRRTTINEEKLSAWATSKGFAQIRFMTGGIEEWKEWQAQRDIQTVKPCIA